MGGAADVDYLVGCQYVAANDTLFLVAGSSDGSAAVFPVATPGGGGQNSGPLFAAPLACLRGAHEDVVRCMLLGPGDEVMTGGEDSKICLWSPRPPPLVQAIAPGGAPCATSTGPDRVAGNPKRREVSSLGRAGPY